VSLQRSIEATDKLVSLLISFVCVLLCVQAIGLDIQSVLAISGFGGLALGLAGREILENLFNGLLIISSRSFEVGEEIMFTQACFCCVGELGRRQRAPHLLSCIHGSLFRPCDLVYNISKPRDNAGRAGGARRAHHRGYCCRDWVVRFVTCGRIPFVCCKSR